MIKRITLLTAMFFAVSLPMNSQSGKFLIGGKMGFSFSSHNPVSGPDYVGDTKYKSFNLSGAPVFGYFLTENIMAGIDFEFSNEISSFEHGLYEKTKIKSFTLNPLVRYYFNSPFFTEARFTWGISSTYNDYRDDAFPLQDIKYNFKTLGFGAGIGYDIKLAERVNLEPLLYYRWNTYNTEELELKANQSHIFLNLGLVFRI